MATRLQNQVAWISGAAFGIGEATARLFAEEGAAVALGDVQIERGQVVADEIRAAGGRALFNRKQATNSCVLTAESAKELIYEANR
jgi:3alpha(or 20beta)-hydroxysteroid dehydrogenase